MLNKTKRRYTEQLSSERAGQVIQDYNKGLNGVQVYNIKDGVFIGGASPIFKVEIFTNTILDFVNAIGEIAIQFGKLEIQQYGSGYESTITQHIHGYRKAVFYYKKSEVMQKADKDYLTELADADLRKEIGNHNKALAQAEIDELKAIEGQEQQELLALQQAEQAKLDRNKRKKELKERLIA